MRRFLRCTVAAGACVLAVGTVTSAPAVAAGSAASARQAERFLGFEIGEELRYVLGPESALVRGEHAMWSIRLDEVYPGEDGVPEGVFALRHEWQGPQPVGDPPLKALMRLRSEGTLRVNVHGFPLFIQHETVRHLAGYGDEAYTVDYRLEEDHRRYEKRTTMDGRRWYQSVPVPDDNGVNRKAAVGLFAFLPDPPGCLDRYVATYATPMTTPQPNSAAQQPQQPQTPVKVVDNSDCEETLFANPGLLNLAMPAFWEAQGQREYVFFTPVGATGKPEVGVGVGVPGVAPPMGPGGLPNGFPPGSGGGFPSRRNEPMPVSHATYDEVETLRFVERATVRIGTRVRDAWLVEMTGEVGPVYVDNDGVVLRLDLPPVAGEPERFIRRLWPSEF